MRISSVLALSAVFIGLVGCGGGGGDGAANSGPPKLTGVFIDSAVEGISYATKTLSGTTNASGEFEFALGEQITFSVGSTLLPTVAAATVLSPRDLAASASNPEATTTNIARLLQSLDTDGNPDNGITIASGAVENSAAIDFDVAPDDFANDVAVINLVANSGSTNMSLVSADDANTHLGESLADIEQTIVRPTITGHTLSEDNLKLTVTFSVDMKQYYLTQGEYSPNRTYWEDPKTFIVEFNSVQPGGSIRLIPQNFVSVSNQTMMNGLEVMFDSEVNVGGTADGGSTDGDSTGGDTTGGGTGGGGDTDGGSADGGSTDGTDMSSEIVLDLRGTTWLKSSEIGCDGGTNTVELQYSQTGLTVNFNRATDEQDGDGCLREPQTLPEATFEAILAGNRYTPLIVCGGDGMCTLAELNRSLELPANDPRHSCRFSNGQSSPTTQSISHELGSNSFSVVSCSGDPAEVFVKQ